MKLTQSVILSAIICLSGLSFTAGWAVTHFRRVPVTQTPEEGFSNKSTLSPVTTTSVPAHVRDMVALPFDEAYRIIRSASAETLRSYYTDLQQLPLGPTRNAALSVFFKTLIQANPNSAKELIVQLKKDDRWLPLLAIRDAALPQGMEAVADVLLSFDRGEISGCSFDLLGESLDNWGKYDPLALKQFIENHRNQDVERYFDTLIRNWAACDPESAQKWMAEEVRKRPVLPLVPQEDGSYIIEDGDWRSDVEQMGVAWIEGYLNHDPDAAINYILEHADNPELESALFRLGGDLFMMSPEQAGDFVFRLSHKQRLKALDGIADKADPLVRSDANDNSTSPRYVAEWFLQFPSEVWENSIDRVLNRWEEADSQELFAWMADLPAEVRDTMLRRFPSYTTEETVQQDFDSIMRAEDPVLRAGLLEQLMRVADNHREAMLNVLERAQLTEEEKSHLASLIPIKD